MCGLNDWKRIFRGDKSPDSFHHDLTCLVKELRLRLGPECRVVLPALPLQWTTAFAQPLRYFVLGLSGLWDAQKKKLADETREQALEWQKHKQQHHQELQQHQLALSSTATTADQQGQGGKEREERRGEIEGLLVKAHVVLDDKPSGAAATTAVAPVIAASASPEVDFVKATFPTGFEGSNGGGDAHDDDGDGEEELSPQEHEARGLFLLASDGVHPNEVGYRLWGDHIARNLGEILRKQRAEGTTPRCMPRCTTPPKALVASAPTM
jgi:hypothetical protein